MSGFKVGDRVRSERLKMAGEIVEANTYYMVRWENGTTSERNGFDEHVLQPAPERRKGELDRRSLTAGGYWMGRRDGDNAWHGPDRRKS